MYKLLFGALLGAVLMYFFDPNRGGERRQMLAERLSRDEGEDDTGRDTFSRAREQATATVNDARDRAQSTMSHARERFSETVEEARSQAAEFGQNTQERVKSVTGGDQQGGDVPNA